MGIIMVQLHARMYELNSALIKDIFNGECHVSEARYSPSLMKLISGRFSVREIPSTGNL